MRLAGLLVSILLLSGCGAHNYGSYDSTRQIIIEHVEKKPSPVIQQGKASWYGGRFHGRLTASGTKYNQYAMTAAHKTLPFGTIVEVVDTSTNKSIYVTINDRGPYVKGRIIDLSLAAARALNMQNKGISAVQLRIARR